MEEGFSGQIEDLVCTRARRALALGCDGVVCSGLEAKRLRQNLGNRFFIVTPGIRPQKGLDISGDDQKRIVTVEQAIANGADYLVIGRPIRTAKDPVSTVEHIREEILQGLDKAST